MVVCEAKSKLGRDESTATMVCISVDHGSKATLLLTIPCHEFKLSVKDSTLHPFKTSLQGVRCGLYAPWTEATYVSCPWGIRVPYFGTLGEQQTLAPHF
ncbi:hypothetical protein AXF42_Ash021068 [Apostasia shenzhenica]|uniref:Uncharacterized protein n=1 Tax=Apostasia shenzhenica TaxID=1088818 RepID=A0A2I0A4I0_9ASPA|nr:hypothetical protein AXF42_Ash021068 [Apostasia shenzhenica]